MPKEQTGSQKKRKNQIFNKPGVKQKNNLILRFPLLWLILITALVYLKTLTLEYTKLDDTIFIIENQHFNETDGNITASFHRGLFNPTRDVYYRPIFLVDFIIESRFFGIKPFGYHLTNLLFHILSVILLFVFFRKIRLPEITAFIMTLLFAVHPVLTQAVAWIPGRNDMLLMIFFLSGMLFSMNYMEKPSILMFILQLIFSFLALFTKETALIIPLLIVVISIFVQNISRKRMIPLILSWVFAIIIWFLMRSTANITLQSISFRTMLQPAIQRFPAIIQYIGKIIFPVNLSVFPVIRDTTLIWGIIAFILLMILVAFSKSYSKPLTWIGVFWFFLFLLPVLIVPISINDQVFEHRLYLPVIGILLILSQTILFSEKWKKNKLLIIAGVIALSFSILNFIRQDYFSDPLTFWTKASDSSPHSAYARMMLGTKVGNPSDRERLFREAYALNPREKNLNFYIGKVLFGKNQNDSAEKYLRRELRFSETAELYFLLAQLSFMKNQFDTAAFYLEKVIHLDPLHPQAHNNLVLLYIQMHKKNKARQVVDDMRLKGMDVPDDL